MKSFFGKIKNAISRFYEKHDLIKLCGGLILIAVLLTWFLPTGYFDGNEMVIDSMSRIGVMDLFTYTYLALYYFTVLVTFIFVLGGLYGVLSKSSGYQKMIENLTKAFKGKEKLLVFALTFIFACVTAVVSETLIPVIFAPFAITIVLAVTKDKILAFVATFGGILVGTIGDLTSIKIAGSLVSILGVEYTTNIWIKVALLLTSYVLLVISTLMYLKKSKKNKVDEIPEMFAIEKPKKEAKSVGTTIVLIIFALVAIIAYIPWADVFQMEWATNLHVWVTETAKVFKHPILSYVFGVITELGTWDLFAVQSLMAITAIIIAIVSKLKLNDFIDAFANGLKKAGKQVMVLIFVYLIIDFAISFPVLPVIFEWIMSLAKGFNYFLAGIVASIGSIFGVEMQYTLQLAGKYLVTEFDSSNAKVLAVMFQSIFGLVQFFVPSSLALMLGLSYLDLPYKNWFKFIWKFLLAMLVIIILILCLMILL